MRNLRVSAAGLCAAISVALGGSLAAEAPVASHSNSCTTGNSNYVAIVFEHDDQGGYKDDICWKDGHSRDDQFSLNETGVDDIGESANFHDLVSSLSLKDNGNKQLCIKFYKDAFRSAFAYWVLLPAGYGDYHVDQVPHNDQYDSLDLTHQGIDGCSQP